MNKTIKLALFAIVVAGCATLVSSTRKLATVRDDRHGAIVRLHMNDEPKAMSFCSGTVISDTLIVTAAHCIQVNEFGGVMIIDIRDNDRVPLGVLAMPVFVNPRADLAVLYGDFRTFKKIKLSKGVKHTMNQLLDNRHGIRSCGYPWSAELTCVDLTARTFSFEPGVGAGINAQGWMLPGMSGGPVLDEVSGELVAVNTAVAVGHVYLSPVAGLAGMFGLDEGQL